MKKDLQKPILFKADPEVFAQMELIKEGQGLNRNRFINEAVTHYIKLIKVVTNSPYLDYVSYNNDHLQRFLFLQCKNIQINYKRIY